MNRAQKLAMLAGLVPAMLGRTSPSLKRVMDRLASETGLVDVLVAGRVGDEVIEDIARALEAELEAMDADTGPVELAPQSTVGDES